MPLLTGAFMIVSRSLLFGGCDGPASALLPLEDGCEEGGWDWD